MLGILGILFAPIIIGALISAAVSYGVHKLLIEPGQERRQDEIEKKQSALATKQEAKAKIAAINQRNQFLASYSRGTVIARKELLDAKRDRQAELARNYGETVKA